MSSRRLLASVLAGALLGSYANPAGAIVLARVTRHGYIVTDTPGEEVYGEVVPASNTRATIEFISEVTRLLADQPGFREGHFLAAMQTGYTRDPLAFYLPIKNDVRGVGMRSALDGRSEVFDTNRAMDTYFPLDGFVYLNSLRFYIDPGAVNYGRYLICTQEFGHRFGVHVTVPPYPAGAGSDAGAAPDASATDASAADASAADASTTDASAADASAMPPALEREALLGRGNRNAAGMVVNRAHWSYFFHTGGSPMEGNNWEETAPGTFRTTRPTFRFSDLDLYLMGLMPASEVRPSFLIAEPTMVPQGIGRGSPTEYYNRQVTVRGRRVDITVDDIIRANGPRTPAYPAAKRDLDVVWVLLANPGEVDDALAEEFDMAIESCSLGYSTATNDRGHLVPIMPEGHDAGAPDATPPPDTAPAADAGDAATTTDATATDAAPPPPATEPGGCGCVTAPGLAAPTQTGASTRGALAALGLAGALVASRRRRRRAGP